MRSFFGLVDRWVGRQVGGSVGRQAGRLVGSMCDVVRAQKGGRAGRLRSTQQNVGMERQAKRGAAVTFRPSECARIAVPGTLFRHGAVVQTFLALQWRCMVAW